MIEWVKKHIQKIDVIILIAGFFASIFLYAAFEVLSRGPRKWYYYVTNLYDLTVQILLLFALAIFVWVLIKKVIYEIASIIRNEDQRYLSDDCTKKKEKDTSIFWAKFKKKIDSSIGLKSFYLLIVGFSLIGINLVYSARKMKLREEHAQRLIRVRRGL